MYACTISQLPNQIFIKPTVRIRYSEIIVTVEILNKAKSISADTNLYAQSRHPCSPGRLTPNTASAFNRITVWHST